MNGFAYWQYTLTAKAIVPKSLFQRQTAFTDPETPLRAGFVHDGQIVAVGPSAAVKTAKV